MAQLKMSQWETIAQMVNGNMLILVRGASGSGKTYLAERLLQTIPNSAWFETDKFFMKDGKYQFIPNKVPDAHAWCQAGVHDAFLKNVQTIIVSNTFCNYWEMRPYVEMALASKYKVMFATPATRWSNDMNELAVKNVHGLGKDFIMKQICMLQANPTPNNDNEVIRKIMVAVCGKPVRKPHAY